MRYGAAITGVGAYVPDTVLTNEELSRMVETDDDWIVTRTGIHQRHIAAPGEGSSHLATRAAGEALARAGLAPGDLDLILVATCTPDMVFPSTAALVQGSLGASRAGAMDLNAACAGFIYALVTGAQFIENGACRHVLVVGAETFSRLLDYADRTTCILFGDGAGAVVLSRRDEGMGMLDFSLQADGTRGGMVHCPAPGSPRETLEALGASAAPHFRQDGRAVFRLAVGAMADAVQSLLERQGLGVADLRLLVPHQANRRIMGAVAERIGLPEERVATCIAECGNTSAASIPLALHRWLATGSLEEGDLVMFCGFGGGLVWGSALFRWAASHPWGAGA